MTYLQKKLPRAAYDLTEEKPDTPIKKKRSQAGTNKYRYLSHHGENNSSKPQSLPRVADKKASIKNSKMNSVERLN